MFQRAEPDENGLGVSTCTPGLVRSSQVSMCLGLPLRTMNTTTEFGDEALVLVGVPACCATRPALTRRVTSGSSEKAT